MEIDSLQMDGGNGLEQQLGDVADQGNQQRDDASQNQSLPRR